VTRSVFEIGVCERGTSETDRPSEKNSYRFSVAEPAVKGGESPSRLRSNGTLDGIGRSRSYLSSSFDRAS
jgi:hypothetical protein